MRARLLGLWFAVLGVALLAGGWIFTSIGFGPSVFLIVPAPALVLVGGLMVARPGALPEGPFDFSDWVDVKSRGERALLYLLGFLGIGFGVLFVFYLGGWTVEGVVGLLL